MPRKIRVPLVLLLFVVLAGACAGPVAEYRVGESCDAGGYSVVDNYYGARRGTCEVFADGHVRLNILPENDGPINNSAWYSFKLVPKQASEANIVLRYRGGNHRYWPKVSTDGESWQRLEATAVNSNFRKSTATFRIALTEGPVWVSAQELLMPADMEQWIDDVSAASAASKSLLGVSTRKQPVYKMDINSGAQEVVFLIGRQHPPEVSGAFGFLAFYEAILAETDAARQFRNRFHIVAIPILNPDGVLGGNWRYNIQGVDLNRDWGPFTQPETRLVRELLDSYDNQGKKIRIFVDFHSTKENLMYTQLDQDSITPPHFTDQWLAAVVPRLENYEFRKVPRPISDKPTGKKYMRMRYGIPSVTYEVADEEDRAAIAPAAKVFAEELMRLLNGVAP